PEVNRNENGDGFVKGNYIQLGARKMEQQKAGAISLCEPHLWTILFPSMSDGLKAGMPGASGSGMASV
ncbi:hypothetical protein ACQP3L_33505, partial [Escherichia coli]